jgi:lysozyme
MRRYWLWGLLALVVACSAEPGGEQVGELEQAAQCPPGTTVEGIDVYDGQGTINWTKVKAGGREFAFIKATQGDYNTQKTFDANWTGSKAAGVMRSPYHFFDPTIDGIKQANHFLATVQAAGGFATGDLAPMLDIECPISSDQATADGPNGKNCEYTGNSGWVDSATMAQRIFDWLNTVEQATGRKAILYSYVSWFSSVMFTDARLAQYPLFIASYNNCPTVPAPWSSTVFWQYSATTGVSGIGDGMCTASDMSGCCDVDRFIGTLGQLGGLGQMPDAGAPGDGGSGAGDGGTTGDGGAGGGDGGGPLEDAAPPTDSGWTGGPMDAASTSSGCSCRAAGAGDAPAGGGGAWAAAVALALAAVRQKKRFGAQAARSRATSLTQE